MSGNFSDGNWTEPIDPTCTPEQVFEAPYARSILSESFKPVPHRVHDDEVDFISNSPVRVNLAADEVTTGSAPEGHDPSSGKGSTISGQPKRHLSSWLDSQIAVRPPGEQMVDEIISNIGLTGTPLSDRFKLPKPQTLSAAYTDLRKSQDWLDFENDFTKKIGSLNGNKLRACILQFISVLHTDWYHNDEQTIGMVYKIVSRSAKKDPKLLGINEKIQRIFLKYQYVQNNARESFLDSVKSGSLPNAVGTVRCVLFRQIQCARDEGSGQFQNEFIDLFDAIVAYLTVTTFVSFDFAGSRLKITVQPNVSHDLWQKVLPDGTLEKIDQWWFRVQQVIDELSDIQDLAGIEGLVPSLFELNRLFYLCIAPECFMQAIVPAVTALNIVFVEKVPMLKNDNERDQFIANAQGRWNNIEQAGVRAARRSTPPVKQNQTPGNKDKDSKSNKQNQSPVQKDSVCQSWVLTGECSDPKRKCGKKHVWRLRGKGQSAYDVLAIGSATPAEASEKKKFIERNFEKAPEKLVTFKCKDCDKSTTEDETIFTGPVEYGCMNATMTVRCEDCRAKRRADKKAMAARDVKDSAVTETDVSADSPVDSDVDSDSGDKNIQTSDVPNVSGTGSIHDTALLASMRARAMNSRVSAVVVSQSQPRNETCATQLMSPGEIVSQMEFESRHNVVYNMTAPQVEKMKVLNPTGSEILDKRACCEPAELLSEISVNKLIKWSDVVKGSVGLSPQVKRTKRKTKCLPVPENQRSVSEFFPQIQQTPAKVDNDDLLCWTCGNQAVVLFPNGIQRCERCQSSWANMGVNDSPTVSVFSDDTTVSDIHAAIVDNELDVIYSNTDEESSPISSKMEHSRTKRLLTCSSEHTDSDTDLVIEIGSYVKYKSLDWRVIEIDSDRILIRDSTDKVQDLWLSCESVKPIEHAPVSPTDTLSPTVKVSSMSPVSGRVSDLSAIAASCVMNATHTAVDSCRQYF